MRVVNFLHDGAFAEFVVVDSQVAIKYPSSISEEKVAVLPLVGVLATKMLDHIQNNNIKTISINGTGVGVVYVVLQLAKILWHQVIALAHKISLKKLCNELGIDVVVDYKYGLVNSIIEITRN